MKKYDVIVIGAGISGMSLAHYCARAGLQVLVLEKGERAGGCIHSHRVDGDSGFWLELGAHTCYNSYGNLLKIMEDCGIVDRIVKREKVGFKMLADNKISSIPSRLNIVELLLSIPHLFTLKKTGRSIKSYYSRVVGKSNYERVFGHAFDAVISQKADDFPAEMLFKKRPRRKDILKSFTLAGGLQTIIDSIESRPGIEVIRESEVQRIEYREGCFDV